MCMDTDSPLPRITASDLLQRAAQFAEEMVRGSKKLNRQYPFPKGLTKAERKALQDAADATYPTPEEMRTHFEELFCLYMAQHYVIVPDPCAVIPDT